MTPDDTMPLDKPWWQSRGVIGALVAIAASILAMRGWDLDREAWTEILLQVLTVIGSLVALWGRIAANRPIRVRRATAVKPRANPKNQG